MTRKQQLNVAFGKGLKAHKAGIAVSECPYKMKDFQSKWCQGWYVARKRTAPVTASYADTVIAQMGLTEAAAETLRGLPLYLQKHAVKIHDTLKALQQELGPCSSMYECFSELELMNEVIAEIGLSRETGRRHWSYSVVMARKEWKTREQLWSDHEKEILAA